MWNLLKRKAQATITVGASFVLLIALQQVYGWISGMKPSPLGLISIIVTILGCLAIVAQSALFGALRRSPWLQAKTFPDLNGSWTGTMVSTWAVDPTTSRPPDPIPATFTIRQTLFSTKVTLKTSESDSVSDHEVLEPHYDIRRFRIWYSYTNTPKTGVRDRSGVHDGVGYLEMDWDSDRNKLVGRYYTDRQTAGEIELKRKAGPAAPPRRRKLAT